MSAARSRDASGVVGRRSAASWRSSSAPLFVVLALAVIGGRLLGPRRRRRGALAGRLQEGRPQRQLGDLCRRRQQARPDRFRRSAVPGLDKARAQAAAAGDGRDRGPALLRARRHRPRGHRPRRAEEPRSGQDGRGRLDDHPAAGPQPLHRNPEARPRTQDHRGEAGGRVRRTPFAAGNPRPVPQHRLLRDGRRRDRGRGRGRRQDLLLQAGLEARPGAGGAAGRPAPGALRIQPAAAPARGAAAAQRGAARRWPSLGFVPARARAPPNGAALGSPPRAPTSRTASRSSSTTSKTS